MICKKCRNRKHHKCKNGPWALGTWCSCQHRVKPASLGYQLYLAAKYGAIS